MPASLPDRPSQIAVGPELRLAFPLDPAKRWVLGMAFDLLRTNLPTAEWELTPSGCTPGPKCYVDPRTIGAPRYYTFRTQTDQVAWLGSMSLLLSFAFGPDAELGHVFGGLGFHPTFTNDGFTDEATANGQVTQKGWLPLAVAGYAIRLAPARLSASLFVPMGGDTQSIRYGLGGQLSVGFELGGPESAPKPTAGNLL